MTLIALDEKKQQFVVFVLLTWSRFDLHGMYPMDVSNQ